MAYRAFKTEHSGAKHGKGAFHGRKQEAKLHSRKKRRQDAKHEIRHHLEESGMSPIEQNLLEAVGNLFKNSEANLGIVPHHEHSHTMQYQSALIEDMFALKCVDSKFHNDLCGAFRNIHSYKYLEDPTFAVALDKRLVSCGVPTEERKKAVKYIEEIKKELGGEDFQERQAGWHENLDEILDTTRNATNRTPKYLKPYTGGGPAPKKGEIK